MASTTEEIAPPMDHSTPKQCIQKVFGCEYEDSAERKSLQTLQQSALDDTALVGIGLPQPHHGKNGKSTEKAMIRPSHGHIKLYHDASTHTAASSSTGEKSRERPVTSTSSCSGSSRGVGLQSRGTQTDDSLLEDLIQQRLLERGKRNHSFVDQEEEGDAYALMVKEPVPESYWKEVAEQRRLALSDTLEENKSLHQSMESLKEENDRLQELASHAEQLSSLLQLVVSDDDDDNDDEEDDKKSEDKETAEEQEPATNIDENDHSEPQSSQSDPENSGHSEKEAASHTKDHQQREPKSSAVYDDDGDGDGDDSEGKK